MKATEFIDWRSTPHEAAFEFYLKEKVELGKMYKSPLRKDNNPTCSFWKSAKGKLYFHDFGTGKMYDIMDFIQARYGIGFVQAEVKFRKDYPLMSYAEEVPTEKKELVFEFTPERFELSKPYWDSYKIPLSMAAKYCFYAKSVYKNETYWGRSTKTNPIFIYKFISGNMKIYRPLAEKAKKWGGNANAKDVGGFFQLKKRGTICFVTSSIKDIMVLRQHGFPSICFNGEAYGTSETSDASKVVDMYIKILKTRFKHVCLFLDNDEAGLTSAALLGRKHRIPFITTESDYKDISDFQKKFGVHKTYKLIKKRLRSHFKSLKDVPF